jgi:outer membrane lipoprotein-sorting protein
MSNSPKEEDREGDVLARLAEAFADLSVPAGPPAAVKERLLVSLGQQSAQPAAVRSLRSWKGINMRKAMSAAIFLVAATAAAAYWIPRPGGTSAAFAEMLNRIQEIRTVSFQMAVDMKEFPDEFPLATRLTAMDPGWLRTEVLIGGQRAVMISNYSQQKQLVLFPETKQGLLRPIRNAKAMQGKNYVQRLRNLKEQHATFVGDDQIDGKPALKYDYQHRGDAYTLWLDAATKLPVRVESASEQDPSQEDVHMTMSDFVWDVAVNEADFSLELPEGYEMMAADALGGTPSGE